jgi:ketosteroid isomerase-like protein
MRTNLNSEGTLNLGNLAYGTDLTLCQETVLPGRPSCTHIRGHGGAKEAIRQVHANLPQHTHVFRTDVKSYYASIDTSCCWIGWQSTSQTAQW